MFSNLLLPSRSHLPFQQQDAAHVLTTGKRRTEKATANAQRKNGNKSAMKPEHVGWLSAKSERWKKIASAPRSSDWWGLAILLLGIFFYIVAYRTIQARVAAGSIPFVLFGLIAFLWGRHVAKHFIFPLMLVYFAIPLPGLTQATNGLQVIATQIAYHVSSLCGADIIAAGTNIQSAAGKWDALAIAEGCSGVRSLIALTFIAAVYGNLTQDKVWKHIVLIGVSVPLAILANSIRVTTIILIAEYGDAEFAAKTYHNFSGFIFFPMGLAGLLLCGFLINGGWKRERQKTTTRIIQSGAEKPRE